MRPILVLVLILAGLLDVLGSSGGASAATVAFDVESGRPMVDLTVNGRGPYRFVLDTGAPGLVVMQSLVEELALAEVGRTQLSSPAGGTPIDSAVVRVESVGLGGLTVEGLDAVVLDMEGHGLGRGIVGPAVFRKHGPTTLDFRTNSMKLGDTDALAGVDAWLPFGESAPLLDVPVRIGDLAIPGHIDTGSPGTLAVPAGLEDRLPLTGPSHTIGRGRTIDAEFEIRAAPINGSARIGGAEVPLNQIVLSELPVANLGTAGLKGLVLSIDWAGERFALTGTAEPAAAPHGQRMVRQMGPPPEGPRFGIRAMPAPDGSIQIAGTEPGSPAEALGLLAGDKIVAINGKAMGDLEHAQVRTELQREDLELTIVREGETLKLKRGPKPGGGQG